MTTYLGKSSKVIIKLSIKPKASNVHFAFCSCCLTTCADVWCYCVPLGVMVGT